MRITVETWDGAADAVTQKVREVGEARGEDYQQFEGLEAVLAELGVEDTGVAVEAIQSAPIVQMVDGFLGDGAVLSLVTLVLYLQAHSDELAGEAVEA